MTLESYKPSVSSGIEVLTMPLGLVSQFGFKKRYDIIGNISSKKEMSDGSGLLPHLAGKLGYICWKEKVKNLLC